MPIHFAVIVMLLAAPPATPRHAVTDTYHGVTVRDDYRWLEAGDSNEVRAWSDAQAAYARGVLDALPAREAIRARVAEVLTGGTVDYDRVAARGGRLFALKREPPKQQPFLVVHEGGAERVLLDPGALDPAGHTAIDWHVPSPDGALVAVSLSKKGSEIGDLHIFDAKTGQRVHEVVPRVNGGTAGGDVAWSGDGRGLFYTRYPRGEERPAADRDFYVQVWFHELGTPGSADRYEMGRELPRIAEIMLDRDARTGRVLATVQDGDGGDFAHFLRAPDGQWRTVAKFGEGIVQVVFAPAGDELYAVSRKDAPRGKLLRLPAKGAPETVVPEGADAIVTDFWGAPTVVATAQRLYVVYQLGGPSALRVFDRQGKPLAAPEQRPVGSVDAVEALGGDDVLFRHETFVDPAAWYRFRDGRTEKTALQARTPVDLSDVTVVREMARSRDGTAVPVNLLLPRGAKRDGTNALVLTGYGGYGISIEPRFRPQTRVELEQGVIYAVANLRGGGEMGEAWHREGSLTKKQNVFDDFAGVIAHLVERGYTTSSRLGIQGGSNGGLLMGATLVQHPRSVRAVVSHVGLYDMLRSELSSNGAFNIPEFGSVRDAAQFAALHAYSPFHHVADGTKYPATLMLTGANDPRVDPLHSRKMIARLQAADPSGEFLLRVSADAGHGGDTALDERVRQLTDVYAFMFQQLGVVYR